MAGRKAPHLERWSSLHLERIDLYIPCPPRVTLMLVEPPGALTGDLFFHKVGCQPAEDQGRHHRHKPPATCGEGSVDSPAKKHESCCKTLPVTRPAGDYFLDKYLITAGRMRQFVERTQGNLRGFTSTLPEGGFIGWKRKVGWRSCGRTEAGCDSRGQVHQQDTDGRQAVHRSGTDFQALETSGSTVADGVFHPRRCSPQDRDMVGKS